jgi:tetratricopeptide (TPR) repeat protein
MVNKKLFYPIAMGILLIALISLLQKYDFFQPSSRPSSPLEYSSLKRDSNKLLKSNMVSSHKIYNTSPKLDMKKVFRTLNSENCQNFQNDVLQMGIEKFTHLSLGKDSTSHDTHNFYNDFEKCRNHFDEHVVSLIQEIKDFCLKGDVNSSVNQEPLTTVQCQENAINLKSRLVVNSLSKPIQYDQLDSSTLLHLVNYQINENTFFKDPKNSLKILNQLLDVEPNYLDGIKTKLLLLNASKGILDSNEIEQEFENALGDAQRITLPQNSANTEQIISGDEHEEIIDLKYQYLIEKNESADSLTQELLELKEKNPDVWVYDFNLAKLSWKNGRGHYQETLNYLEGAIKKSPDNIRLLMTLQNLKSQDKNLRNSPFILPSGLNNSDL